MVLRMGLEPTHLSAYAPQAYMSTIPSPELISRVLFGSTGCIVIIFFEKAIFFAKIEEMDYYDFANNDFM